jgi:hypothetical protein
MNAKKLYDVLDGKSGKHSCKSERSEKEGKNVP